MKRIGFIDGRRVAGFTFPATATPGNGQVMNITDPSIIASGTNRGRYTYYKQTGAKTGTARVDAEDIDLFLEANVLYAYGKSIYLTSSGENPTIGGLVAPIHVYVDDLGTGIVNFAGLDLGLALENAPSGRHCFMRLRNHTDTLVKDVARIEGRATNLFYFDTVEPPILGGAVGAGQTHKIRVEIDETDYFIALYTS